MNDVGATVAPQANFSLMQRTAIGAFGPEALRSSFIRPLIHTGVMYVASSDALTSVLSRQWTIRSYVHCGAFVIGYYTLKGTLQLGMAAEFIFVDRESFDRSVDLRSVSVLIDVVRKAIKHVVPGLHTASAARKLR